MTTVRVETLIRASPEACFDLARDVEFHARSLAATGERVVESPRDRTLLEMGDSVTFEGRHFGVRQRHRARITAFDRPRHFRDEMIAGAFRAFIHDHDFAPEASGDPACNGTRMTDVVRFEAPFGPLGWVVSRVVLRPYLARLLTARAEEIRRAAEGA